MINTDQYSTKVIREVTFRFDKVFQSGEVFIMYIDGVISGIIPKRAMSQKQVNKLNALQEEEKIND